MVNLNLGKNTFSLNFVKERDNKIGVWRLLIIMLKYNLQYNPKCYRNIAEFPLTQLNRVGLIHIFYNWIKNSIFDDFYLIILWITC